ncbi:SulP family inorganic anion transporter [Candidatus Saccharibacteria bacterium]|nr:SulP family inorganic anion transporter [Candidatus Saccharibacteria bacterium]
MHKLFRWGFAGYKTKYIKSDLMAALVVTAIAIPESLGFAVIVGLPPVTGLYSALFAPMVFGVLAHTKRLVIGADSATAALVASGALLVAQAGSPEYANAIGLLGLLTAGVLLLMGVSGLGFLADLISRPVLVGFLAGVGVQLMTHKLPEMLGLSASGSLWQHVVAVAQGLTAVNGMTVTISVLVVGIVVITRRTRIPGELIGLLAAVGFALVFQVGDYGVQFVGALPQGLPQFVHPSLSAGDVVTLLPAALSIAIVILAQSSAVIRSQANEHDEKVRLNQDLMALGVANAVSALTRGFAVNGSPPRTLAADMAGARSQLVNIIMGVIIGILLLFGGELFRSMPSAALAAIVFMIGLHLIRFSELRYLWRTHKTEFLVAMVALVGTALFGVRQGVLIAVVVSLMERLSRQYHPKDAVLLRDGALSDWAIERLDPHHRHTSRPHGLLVYSFDGSLFFENINYFVARLKRAIEAASEPVHYVVVDAGAIDNIDYTAVENLKMLVRQLSSDGIRLGFAHVSPALRQQFDNYGVVGLVGKDNIFPTLNAAIKARPDSRRSSLEMIQRLKLPAESYVVIGGAVLEALDLRQTHDVDVVVSDNVYREYRDEHHWQEYVQDNGKKILSHNGYNLMHTWMGKNLKYLKKSAFVVDGISLMSVDDLIDAKRRLGRKKDISDIALLTDYRHTQSTSGKR